MLEIRDLYVKYGRVEAVRGVSMSVQPSKVHLVLGANGAGKTSTLKTVAGLIRPSSGQVLLDGEAITGFPTHRTVGKGIALVPEGRQVLGPLTILENLRIGGYTTDRRVLNDNLDRVLEMFPILAERIDSAAGLLSGGEQQMLAFGRALMSQPRVLLLDEPSMGLAPVIVDQILAKVREMADSGIAVLMVEQNAESGLQVADEVSALARGTVAFQGSATDARNSTSVLRAFLGEAALSPEGLP